MMASGGIVDFMVQGAETMFFLSPHKREALLGTVQDVAYAPLYAVSHQKLLDCFSKDGPQGLNICNK